MKYFTVCSLSKLNCWKGYKLSLHGYLQSVEILRLLTPTRHSPAGQIVAQNMRADTLSVQRCASSRGCGGVFSDNPFHSVPTKAVAPDRREDRIIVASGAFLEPHFQYSRRVSP